MSRLDSFIARMQAQRDCLNFLKPAIDALPGPCLLYTSDAADE